MPHVQLRMLDLVKVLYAVLRGMPLGLAVFALLYVETGHTVTRVSARDHTLELQVRKPMEHTYRIVLRQGKWRLIVTTDTAHDVGS